MQTSTAMARQDATSELVHMLLNNRQYLVRTIIDNNHLAVVRNMQDYLHTNEVFTPNGLEKIVMAAKTPDTIAAMDQVLDVPWQQTQDPALNRAYLIIQQQAQAAGGANLRVFPIAGAAAALGSLIGLIAGGKKDKDAERAAQEAARQEAIAANNRKQMFIIGAIAVGTLVVVLILYKLASK